MSRRRKWQPPHPDVEQARNPGRRSTVPSIDRCQWQGCPFPKTELRASRIPGAPSRRFGLCDLHLSEAVACFEQNESRINRSIDKGEGVDRPDLSEGTIYYALIDNTVKIGYTTDLHRRMRQYPPTSRLLAVEPGTRKLETARHSLFRAHLAHGREWFTPNPELDAWIAQLVELNGPPPFEYPAFTRPGDTQPVVGGKHFTFDRAM